MSRATGIGLEKSANVDKAEWIIYSSSVIEAAGEVSAVLPAIRDSFWSKSGSRIVLVFHSDPKVLKAVNRAVAEEVGVETNEIWGNDKVILKLTQSALRSDAVGALQEHLTRNLGGYTASDCILRTAAGELAPDVGWWTRRPSRERRQHPLRAGNEMELPNLWIEIAGNIGEDIRIANEKIWSLREHSRDSMVLLLLVLPEEFTNACMQRIGFDDAVVHADMQTLAPRIQTTASGPYIRLWRIDGEENQSDCYLLHRNQKITFAFGVGADQVNYTLEMNALIDSFA
jgi:hypothetical protein